MCGTASILGARSHAVHAPGALFLHKKMADVASSTLFALADHARAELPDADSFLFFDKSGAVLAASFEVTREERAVCWTLFVHTHTQGLDACLFEQTKQTHTTPCPNLS